MNFWWVNQRKRFHTEKDLQILWHPRTTKSGNYTEFSQKILGLRQGDFVFHYHENYIKAVSKVLNIEYNLPRPDTELHNQDFKQETGILIFLDLQIIPPIPLYELPQKFFWGHEQYGNADNIFTENCKVRSMYCLRLSATIVGFLHRNFSSVKSLIPEVFVLDESHDVAEEYNVDGDYTGSTNPRYTLTDLQENLFVSSEFTRKLKISLNRKQQIVIFGVPGSGKTYLAEKLANTLISESDGFIKILQFHPAYTYEDFIQGLRPLTDIDGNLRYEIVLGRFLEFCEKARQRDGKCVLIIDEINRANLSAVFGELMYLLEYRDQAIKLAGSNEPFSIPENVYIIGTMNTADRSIALVDHALRRRFAFIELRPDYDILREWHKREETGFDVNPLISQIEEVNEAIGDRHYYLGISYFLDENLKENIADIWELEIYPYLEEYFYDNPEKCDVFKWENIENVVLGDPPHDRACSDRISD